MKPSSAYSDLVPLDSDARIEARVGELIGRANMRQLWLLFLDESDVQLPLLVPIDGLPSRPTSSGTTSVVENIAVLMTEIGAAALVVVFERYGPSALLAQDIAWARAMSVECAQQHVRLRAMLLSHRGGVRWVAADDYV